MNWSGFFRVFWRKCSGRNRYELSYAPGDDKYHFSNYDDVFIELEKHICPQCLTEYKENGYCGCSAEWIFWDYYKDEGGVL